MTTTSVKLATIEELENAASAWLATKGVTGNSTWIMRQLAAVCNAVQNDLDVFLVCVKAPASYDKGAHHYGLLYVTMKGRVEQFFPDEESYKVLGFGKSRSKETARYTMSSGGYGMSRALDASSMLQDAINAILEMGGSSQRLQQLSSSRF